MNVGSAHLCFPEWEAFSKALPEFSLLYDKWLGDVGVRVKDLEESLEFYTQVLGLMEIDRGSGEESTYVLLKDAWSGQRLELNWYANQVHLQFPMSLGRRWTISRFA